MVEQNLERDNDFISCIRNQLLESAEVKRRTAETCADSILKAAHTIVDSINKGGKVILCGNGGSAADAQHLAAELVGRLKPGHNRRSLAALALTTDSSILTALANDFGFDRVFARQIEALGKADDILVAISTSGNSQNIIEGVKAARRLGIKSIGFLGQSGGRLRPLADLAIMVPSEDVQRIQEGHAAISHILCDLVERMLFPGAETTG